MPSHLHLAATRPSDAELSLASLPIRTVLAEDHPLMRSSLRLLLDHEVDFEVVAEAGNLASTQQAVERLRPQVLVLDLCMPDGSSVEVIDSLRARMPQTHIVALTTEHNPAFARRALAAGAIGFAVKELADVELPQAIRAAVRGERYVSPRVADRLRPRARRHLRSADGHASG